MAIRRPSDSETDIWYVPVRRVRATSLASALNVEAAAYDSLRALAGRAAGAGAVWTAQPGRRGEVYARPFEVAEDAAPRPVGELQVLSVSSISELGPWVAAEALDLGGVPRLVTSRSTAEGLLRLIELGVEPQPLEPLYVEGAPIHGCGR